MRVLYFFASYLLTPALLLHLASRGLRNHLYWQRWGERFGRYQGDLPLHGIVVHAVSVGEVNAAAPLVRALLARFPDLPITVTCFTPTGSERIKALFADSVHHVYFPLDLPGTVRRFCWRAQPRLLIIMETEIWPNLYYQAAKQKIPMVLANARISEKSFPAYRRLRPLIRFALTQVSRIAAQSTADAQRFIDLGAIADRIEVTGNLKFDLSLPVSLHEQGQALRQGWGAERPVFLAASTREGDEEPVLKAFHGVLKSWPNALLVLVPRHPERFQRCAQLVRDAGLTMQFRSAGPSVIPATQCLVVDAMGELLPFYAACDVAFVGGSLAATGGHNVLEPAALSVPVLVGPHTFNFADITRQLIAAGGAIRVNDAAELEQAAVRLLGDAELRLEMGTAGRALVLSGQGALSRTLEICAELLGQDYCNS